MKNNLFSYIRNHLGYLRFPREVSQGDTARRLNWFWQKNRRGSSSKRWKSSFFPPMFRPVSAPCQVEGTVLLEWEGVLLLAYLHPEYLGEAYMYGRCSSHPLDHKQCDAFYSIHIYINCCQLKVRLFLMNNLLSSRIYLVLASVFKLWGTIR